MYSIRTVLTAKTLSILFLTLVLVAATRSMLTPSCVYVICDQKLPLVMQHAIKHTLESAAVRSVGADVLCKNLQNDYPSVASISIAYKGSLTAQVSVTAHVPWVTFASTEQGQKEQVLCKQGNVVEKKFFNELVTQGIQTLVIDGKEYNHKIADKDLIACMLELRRSVFDEYTIVWKSKVEIILQSRTEPLTIIADTATVHDGERFGYVDRIYASDMARYKNGMKADIRLKDEIVCSPL